MSQGQFSSVMLIANDGLLQNQGLAISGNLTIAINAYNSTTPVADYLGILSSAFANVGVANNQITANTFYSLQSLAASNFPAITDAVPSAYSSNIVIGNSTAGFSGAVASQGNLILGNGDIGKFAQVYNQCQSYIAQNNPYINTVKNSSILNSTFTSMNSITTAGISDINRTLPIFGADLTKLGQTWDLSNLNFLGFPWALVYQLSKVGGILPELSQRFVAAGVSSTDIINIQNGQAVSSTVDALLYTVMTTITGSLLDQVKIVLDVTTPGITTMADLLNPIKTLPTSYRQLTIQLPTGATGSTTSSALVNVYNSANTINSNLLVLFGTDPIYIELAKVIPQDQALANRAIAIGLQQIKNVFSLTLPALSKVILTTETNAGLGNITALTTPVPTSVKNSLNSMLATGTGPNGTLTLFDFMGATAGIPYTDEFTNAAATINYMQTANALYYLTDSTNGVYSVMQKTLNGVYTTVIDPGPPIDLTITIPVGLPGEGTYTSLDLAFTTGLIPAAANLIANVVTANPGNVTSLNNNFTTMASHLSAEITNLNLAQVHFGDLAANSRSAIMSLGSNLHEIGTDVAPQGQNDFFTAIADTSNQYGQAIIASFREGRNLKVYNNAGIGTDSQIPSSSV